MQRITEKDLKECVSITNRLTGMAQDPYYRDEQGDFKTNPGTYVLDSAYGGHKLCRMSMTPDRTGQSDISRTGYVSKRELYNWLCAFIAGLEVKP